MAQFTYKDIEEFLLDDDFFQWARYGSSDNGFNLESYKLQHPGCEEKIELAVAMVRSRKWWKIVNLLPGNIRCKASTK